MKGHDFIGVLRGWGCSWLAIVLVGLALAGCRGGRPAPSGATAGEMPSAAGTVFTPVFSAEPVPPAVEARMRGCSYPEDADIPLSELRYLRLSYMDFNGVPRIGEMICNQVIAQDLLEIFEALYAARYPICSIRLMDDFDGDDEASMAADNTSCFNYRPIAGMRRLSRHSLGLAVDINPRENPYVRRTGVRPAGSEEYADRSRPRPHQIDRNDLCYKLFREHGFSWGGAWASVKDYQHFEK